MCYLMGKDQLFWSKLRCKDLSDEKNSKESLESFSVSLRDLARITEKSRMIMVITQLRRIINAYVLQNQ